MNHIGRQPQPRSSLNPTSKKLATASPKRVNNSADQLENKRHSVNETNHQDQLISFET